MVLCADGLVLLGGSARDPDLTWYIEDHALLQRRDDVDRDIIATAERFDHFLDDDLGCRSAGRDSNSFRAVEFFPGDVGCALDEDREFAPSTRSNLIQPERIRTHRTSNDDQTIDPGSEHKHGVLTACRRVANVFF